MELGHTTVQHSPGDRDEIAKHAIKVHELPEDLEGVGKYAFHGEKKRNEVQPFLDGGDILARYIQYTIIV